MNRSNNLYYSEFYDESSFQLKIYVSTKSLILKRPINLSIYRNKLIIYLNILA